MVKVIKVNWFNEQEEHGKCDGDVEATVNCVKLGEEEAKKKGRKSEG